MILITVLILFVIALIAGLADLLIGKLYKSTRKNVKDGIHFIFRFMPQKLPMPTFKQSSLMNMYPDKSNKWTTDMWRMCPSINDEWMKELARLVNERCVGKSDKYKAKYILKIAQCIYSYEHDSKVYGKNDVWQFPVCTAYLRTGDCEDGALFGAGLSKLCGLDTIMIYQEKHALYGVAVSGFGMKVTHNDKHYLKCETTSILPLGITFSEGKVLGTYDVIPMTPEFYQDRTYHDSFDKYKL